MSWAQNKTIVLVELKNITINVANQLWYYAAVDYIYINNGNLANEAMK